MVGEVAVDERQIIERRVKFGIAELLPDPLRPEGWTVAVNGVAQSYVDLDDPGYLALQYVDWLTRVINTYRPGAEPMTAIHVGGAGCTVPRYLASTRPGSDQIVFELDGELVELMREHLELDKVPGLDVRVRDGRLGLMFEPADSADLVVLDVFRGGNVVTELATREFLTEMATVLRPDGLYVANIWDGEQLNFTRRVVSTLSDVFPQVAILGEASTLLGKRPGNLIVSASRNELPVAELNAESASAFFYLTKQQFTHIHGQAEPITDFDRPPTGLPVKRWGRNSRFN